MYVVGPAPSEANALLSAVSWVQNILLGPFATAFAVIAVASIGFMMLTGSLNVRRGACVIFGGLRATAGLAAALGGNVTIASRSQAHYPAGVIGQPEDIARQLLLLAATPYTTGTIVTLDGGASIG